MSNPRVVKMALEEITPADWNPRKISDEDKERLKKSIEEFGNIRPIVYNERTRTLIGGHQRLQCLIEMGKAEWDVFVVDVEPATEKGAALALNNEFGEFDVVKLGGIFQELELANFDLELTGFNEAAAESVIELATEMTAPLTDPTGADGQDESGGAEEEEPPPPQSGGGSMEDLHNYKLIFDTPEQFKIWEKYVRRTNQKFPDEPTLGDRIIRDVRERKSLA